MKKLLLSLAVMSVVLFTCCTKLTKTQEDSTSVKDTCQVDSLVSDSLVSDSVK